MQWCTNPTATCPRPILLPIYQACSIQIKYRWVAYAACLVISRGQLVREEIDEIFEFSESLHLKDAETYDRGPIDALDKLDFYPSSKPIPKPNKKGITAILLYLLDNQSVRIQGFEPGTLPTHVSGCATGLRY